MLLDGEEPKVNGDAAGAAGAAAGIGAGAAVPEGNRPESCTGFEGGCTASVLLLDGEEPKVNGDSAGAAGAADTGVPNKHPPPAAAAAGAGAPNKHPVAGAGAAAADTAAGAAAAETDAPNNHPLAAGAGAGAGAVAAADTGVVPKENTFAACAGFEDSCAASVLFFDGEDPKENGDAAGAGAVFDDGAPNKLPDVTGAVTPNENGLAACTGFEGGCASSDVFEGADWGEARENVTWLAGVVDAGAGAAPKTEALPKRDEPTFAFWLPRPLRPPPKMKRPVAGVSDAVRRCKSERFTI